jgi:hypothetical protein
MRMPNTGCIHLPGSNWATPKPASPKGILTDKTMRQGQINAHSLSAQLSADVTKRSKRIKVTLPIIKGFT